LLSYSIVSRQTRHKNDIDIALFGERRKCDGVTPLRDANVMRKARLDPVVKVDPKVDLGVELDEAVIAQQVALRRNGPA
jgi:hypothetical protein